MNIRLKIVWFALVGIAPTMMLYGEEMQAEEDVVVSFPDNDAEHRLHKILTPPKVQSVVANLFHDTVDIAKFIFTDNTLMALAGIVPFYLIGRRIDEKLQCSFYDGQHHCNLYHPNKFFKFLLSSEGMAIPFGVYAVVGLLSKKYQNRREAQIFITGLLWTWALKTTLKYIPTDGNFRPWHESFSCEKRSYGGLPSGHTSMITFMATYLWLTKGPLYGVPLSAYSAFIAGISIAKNNHYVSQVVAGTGLGVIVGFASYCVAKHVQLPDNIEVGVVNDERAGVGIRIAYNF